jgi:serine/threonine protein kinase
MDDQLALRIIAYLATSLSVAHDAGIIHRDIKPCNILLTKDGRLKISDLGLAKDIRQSEYTMANITMGTPAYMAPESFVSGQIVDHRADIYSLGIILYRMLFGRLPFSGTITQLMSSHLHDKPDYQNRKIQLHSAVSNLLKKMLAKEPSHRFQTCKELSQAISLIIKSDFSPIKNQQEESGVTSSTINRISTFLGSRLGASSSEYQGVRVTHTTSFERILIWIILSVFVALGISSYILLR